ncbi:MAG: hypothetical protein H0X30_00835 [Anaerolineae bacterium]|nr:hypothetical protein [Anaerolineae bacterium]
MDQQRNDRLEAMIASIQQRWGAAALQPLSRLAVRTALPGLLTGFEILDAVLGTQGIPRGQTTEVVGKMTSGATTLVYNVVAAAQQQKQYGIYVDLEATYNPVYATMCGIDNKLLFLARPDTEIAALDIARDLIQQGSVGVIVLDLGETQPNLRDIRRLATQLSRFGCAILLLKLAGDGVNTQTILGNSSAALRLLVQRDEWILKRDDISSYRTLNKRARRKGLEREGKLAKVEVTNKQPSEK